MPSTGWQRTDARVCASDSPPVVCAHAWPDRAVELELGDAQILPGECAVAPRGGRVKARWIDGEGVARTRKVSLRRGVRTELALGADGELHIAERTECDPGMPPLPP